MTDETRETIWELRDGDAGAAQALATSLQLDPLVATLLVNRGVEDAEAAKRFLRPRLSEMPDPFLMKGMEEAVARILGAFERDETVCVWGDYDVDGVTSASQLISFFEAIGYSARFFVPDRFRDGYGLHPERIRELAQSGVDLLITVDCGISNVAEVEIARECARCAGADDIEALDAMIAAQENVVKDPIGFRILDAEFHEKLFAIAGNSVMERLAQGFYNMGLDARRVATGLPRVTRQSVKDHEAIVAGIKAQDPAATGEAMRQHLEHIEQTTLEALGSA